MPTIDEEFRAIYDHFLFGLDNPLRPAQTDAEDLALSPSHNDIGRIFRQLSCVYKISPLNFHIPFRANEY
jgi:hypothetical protein